VKFYNYDEIKRAGDCRRYCIEILGLKPKSSATGANVSFDSPLRPGSDSGAFRVCVDSYFDHVSGDKGSILDLAAATKHAGNMLEAQEWLGEWLNLKPRQAVDHTRRRRFLCAYDYRDADGKLLMQVVRWEPKAFTQRRPNPDSLGVDDEWIWDIKGVPDLIYRLPEIKDSPRAVVVGGEKDADNLAALRFPATTNPGGEGHWKPTHAEFLRGKDVVIMPDQDEVGAKHCAAVAESLKEIARSVRVATIPAVDGRKIKDVSDWIEAGATREMIADLLKGAVPAGTAPAPRVIVGREILEITPEKIAAAKAANKVPFSNYITVKPSGEESGSVGGRPKKERKDPRRIDDMVSDVFTRFLGFPRRLGGSLFDHDRDTGRIRMLENQSALVAWIAQKSGHPVQWTKTTEGAVTYEQFYEVLLAASPEYSMVSGVPSFPDRADVYYTYGKLPEPDPQATRFNELCAFFCPATPADKLLLRAFFASPLYFRQRVPRPLWIIDAEHGQGTGKTQLVEFLACLYGGEDEDTSSPILIDHNQLNNETQYDRVIRRLLSNSGRRKRVVLIDNVDGFFRSSTLSTLSTQATVSGMAPYGRGEESRAMDLTICITFNGASCDTDILHRSLFLTLAKPAAPLTDWSRVVGEFIRKHRLQIMADMLGIIAQGGQPMRLDSAYSRFPGWEREILLPMVGGLEGHSLVFKAVAERQRSADGDAEDAETVQAAILSKLRGLGVDPDHPRPIWVTSQVAVKWAREAVESFGGRTLQSASRVLRNMVKIGKIPAMSSLMEVYPHRGPYRKRGFLLNEFAYLDGHEPRYVGLNDNGHIAEINLEA